MKRDVFDGLKIEGLMAHLDIPRYAAAGILNGLWSIAQRFYPRGDIGRATNRQLAERLGWPSRKADKLVEALLETRWLDPLDGPGRLYIHDWNDHCEDSIHMMIARKKLYFANGSEPKLYRLEKTERKSIEDFYTAQRLTKDLCAQETHEKRTTSCPLPLAPCHSPLPKPAVRTKRAAEPDSASDSASADSASRGEGAGPSTAGNLGEVLGALGVAPPPASSPAPALPEIPDDQRRNLNRLWSRIRRATGDGTEWMAWWTRALLVIVDSDPVLRELLDALEYAENCGDEATREAKGLGPLDKPGAYILSRVGKVAGKLRVQLPELPKRKDAA